MSRVPAWLLLPLLSTLKKLKVAGAARRLVFFPLAVLVATQLLRATGTPAAVRPEAKRMLALMTSMSAVPARFFSWGVHAASSKCVLWLYVIRDRWGAELPSAQLVKILFAFVSTDLLLHAGQLLQEKKAAPALVGKVLTLCLALAALLLSAMWAGNGRRRVRVQLQGFDLLASMLATLERVMTEAVERLRDGSGTAELLLTTTEQLVDGLKTAWPPALVRYVAGALARPMARRESGGLLLSTGSLLVGPLLQSVGFPAGYFPVPPEEGQGESLQDICTGFTSALLKALDPSARRSPASWGTGTSRGAPSRQE
jgi:hypothetical protein